MIFKLAYRNLFRNRWRTGLSVGGIATAVAMLVWTLAYIDGFMAEMVRGATSVDIGQVQIHNAEYVKKPNIRHTFEWTDGMAQTLEGQPQVLAAAPRVRAYGIVGHEKRSVVTRIIGVDPELEAQVSLVKKGLKKGEWFRSNPDEQGPRQVILGAAMARQLKVDVGSELVLLLEAADGSMGNDLLEVIGIVETKNYVVDRTTIFLHYTDLQFIAALEDQVHEVVVKLQNVLEAQEVVPQVSSQLPPELLIRPWQEVLPEIDQMLDMTGKSDLIMYFFIYLIVAFGLFNSQRMSALERRREFGVIRALGVTPMQLGMTVLVETLLLTLMGAVIGAALGFALASYHEANGLDLTMFGDGNANFDMYGVSFSGKMEVVTSARAVYRPVLVLMPVSFLCGLYPAWIASRLSITESISGRT